MAFQVQHIDLTKAELSPAHDLQADGKFMAFRTPGIPWCRFALDAMEIIVYNTNQVDLYKSSDPEIRFTFSCTPEERTYLERLYWL